MATETTIAEPETLADLIENLGGIPLSRIRMKPFPGTAFGTSGTGPSGPPCQSGAGIRSPAEGPARSRELRPKLDSC